MIGERTTKIGARKTYATAVESLGRALMNGKNMKFHRKTPTAHAPMNSKTGIPLIVMRPSKVAQEKHYHFERGV